MVQQKLKPSWPYIPQVREREANAKIQQKRNYDLHHRVHCLPELKTGNTVWITDRKEQGTIVEKAATPRSYLVQTPTSTIRRNRRHLIQTPSSSPIPDPSPVSTPNFTPQDHSQHQTRSGRISRPPQRLIEQ